MLGWFSAISFKGETTDWFSTIFYRIDNFCDFLFALQNTNPLLKRGLLLKGKNLLPVYEKLNSFPTSGDVYCLLITFANSLDPDQAWRFVWPDLEPNCLTLWWYSWKIFLKKLFFFKNPQMTKKHEILPSMQRVNTCSTPQPLHNTIAGIQRLNICVVSKQKYIDNILFYIIYTFLFSHFSI